MAPKKPRRARRRKKAEPDREAIREVLLKFAGEVADAEGAELVDEIVGVDKYVDEIIKVLGS